MATTKDTNGARFQGYEEQRSHDNALYVETNARHLTEANRRHAEGRELAQRECEALEMIGHHLESIDRCLWRLVEALEKVASE